MVEVVDAVESLRHIDAPTAASSLSAGSPLVKRPEDLATFDLLFDVQFRYDGNRRSAAGISRRPQEEQGDGQAAPAPPSGDLRRRWWRRCGTMTRARCARWPLGRGPARGLETKQHGSERYYSTDHAAAGAIPLLQAVTGAEPDAETLDREQLKAGIDEFRRLIAEQSAIGSRPSEGPSRPPSSTVTAS